MVEVKSSALPYFETLVGGRGYGLWTATSLRLWLVVEGKGSGLPHF